MIFYFEAVGKAIEERNPNALYNVSRWGVHAMGAALGCREAVSHYSLHLTIYRHSC